MSSNDNTMPLALVVDDSPDAAETLVMLIEMEGFQAVAAGSLAAARQQLALQTPDLVLLDHQLPDGNGLELLDELAGSQIEVVMLTGSGDPDLVREARRRGATGYLLKPVDMEALGAVLARVRDA